MLTKEPSTDQRVHPSSINPMQTALVRQLPGRRRISLRSENLEQKGRKGIEDSPRSVKNRRQTHGLKKALNAGVPAIERHSLQGEKIERYEA